MTWTAALSLSGRAVLVCGSAAGLLREVGRLLDEHADVRLHTTEPTTSVQDLVDRVDQSTVDDAGLPAAVAAASLVVLADGTPAYRELVTGLAHDHQTPMSVPAPEPDRVGAPSPGTGSGRVVLVGGGPGDVELLTVAGLGAVRTADVIVHDRLAPLGALRHARPDALIIDVGKIPRGAFTPQETINALLVEHGLAGRRVVRLKGGDNFVFGRGGEEWQACAAAGVPVEIIPGVSSALAAPALAGIPLTHRSLTQGFSVVSGHLPPGDPHSTVNWAALAQTNTTIVILMGLATLDAIATELVVLGLDPATPAATVADGGLPSQRVVRGTVADIAAETGRAGIRPPAVTVIGAVAAFSPT